MLQVLFWNTSQFSLGVQATPCSSWSRLFIDVETFPHETRQILVPGLFGYPEVVDTPDVMPWSSLGRPGFELTSLGYSEALFQNHRLKLLYEFEFFVFLFHQHVDFQSVVWIISFIHTPHMYFSYNVVKVAIFQICKGRVVLASVNSETFRNSSRYQSWSNYWGCGSSGCMIQILPLALFLTSFSISGVVQKRTSLTRMTCIIFPHFVVRMTKISKALKEDCSCSAQPRYLSVSSQQFFPQLDSVALFPNFGLIISELPSIAA